MKKSKLIFLILAIIFFLIVLFIAYDISSKTTHPGAKSKNQGQLNKSSDSTDTTSQDSLLFEK